MNTADVEQLAGKAFNLIAGAAARTQWFAKAFYFVAVITGVAGWRSGQSHYREHGGLLGSWSLAWETSSELERRTGRGGLFLWW